MDVASLTIRVGAETSEAENALGSLDKKINNFANSMASQGLAMSTAWTAPLVAAGAAVFKFGSDFESAFTGVIKTVDAPQEVLAGLREDILDMAREVPAAATDIARVMELGGQMGIDPSNLTEFTKVIIDLAEATDIVGESGALSLAQFANVMNMAEEDFGRLGSSIAASGNNFATTESQIVSYAQRLSGAAAVAGMTEADVIGLSTAYSSLGINAEAGGSSASRVIADMGKFANQMGAELETLADIAGMTSGEFSDLIKEDATEALILFTEGLGDLIAAGGNADQILDDLGWGQLRITRLLKNSANAEGLLREAVELSNEAWEENTALTREADLRYGTAASQVEMLRDRLIEVGIRGWRAIRPQIQEVLDSLIGFSGGLADAASGFARIDPALMSAALAFGAVLAAAGPVLLIVSGIATAFGLLLTPIGAVTVAVAGLAAAWASDFMGVRTTVMGVVEAVRPHFETLLGWISAASKGDWGPLKEGLQGALNSVSLAVQDFAWDAYITALDWGAYIGELVWDGYLTVLSWIDYIREIDWSTFVSDLVWDLYLASFNWDNYLTNLLWETYVFTLHWADWLSPLVWDLYVASFDWGDYIEQFMWDAYITAVAWEDYIANLSWGDVVAKLSDWGSYIASINWTHFVSNLIWSTYIAALDWGSVIQGLLWDTYVTSLDWSPWLSNLVWGTYIASINWNDYISELLWKTYVATLSWENYVSNLSWNDFIVGTLEWTGYVYALGWNAFIKILEWATFVPRLVWGEFVKVLTWENVMKTTISWADFVPKLQWGLVLTSPLWPSFIPVLAWGAFVKTVNWSAFIEKLTWSDVKQTTIQWADFITPFRWTTFVPPVAWPVYIPALLWDKVIIPLVWERFVKVLDWLKFATPIVWESFITHANIPDWIPTFSWSDFVENLSWPLTAIDGFDWGTWVEDLAWPGDIFTFDWNTWISDLEWPTPGEILGAIRDRINSLNPFGGGAAPEPGPSNDSPPGWFAPPPGGGGLGQTQIPASFSRPVEVDLQASSVIPPVDPVPVVLEASGLETSRLDNALSMEQQAPSLDFGGLQGAVDQLSGFTFTWPEYPMWEWPPLPTFEWPAYPRWEWPAIPAPSWLHRLVVPRPSWLGELLSWSPTVKAVGGGGAAPAPQGELATGTASWIGGWAVVGEEGPELVNLPRGAAVYPNDVSEQMMGGVTVHIHNPVVNREQDIERMAMRVAEKIRRR